MKEKTSAILDARAKFVLEHCRIMQWDVANLSLKQILEIRKQEGWKNPELDTEDKED